MNAEKLFNELTPPWIARRLRRSRLPRVGARPLNRLDQLLAPILPMTGTYVELGANDGLTQSNTWWLERDRGWSGLLIEPALNRFIQLRENRGSHNRFACAACVPFGFQAEFVPMTYADLMTTTDGVDLVDVERESHHGAASVHAPSQVGFLATARQLSYLIDESGMDEAIDFMSLDVEGAELAVLQGVDFARHRFHWVLVETRNIKEVAAHLEPHGYRVSEQLSVHDHLLVNDSW